VVYILEKTRIHNFVPLFQQGITPNEDILAKIEILYLSSSKQLQSYFANLHLLPSLPELVIIDDFSSFFTSSADKPEMLKTLAFLKEAAYFASEAINESGEKNECGILVGDVVEPDGGLRKLELFEPWTPLIFLIQGQHSPYSLVVQKINKTIDPHFTKAIFKFEEQEFSLTYLEIMDEDQKISAENKPTQNSPNGE